MGGRDMHDISSVCDATPKQSSSSKKDKSVYKYKSIIGVIRGLLEWDIIKEILLNDDPVVSHTLFSLTDVSIFLSCHFSRLCI